MKKTFDVERDSPYIFIRFIDHVDHINCRRIVKESWQAFDEFVTKEQSWLKEMHQITLIHEYDEPWFTVFRDSALQQWNGESIEFNDKDIRNDFIRMLYANGYVPW